MKKYLSVLELAAASTCSKIMAVLAILAAGDLGWFGVRMFLNRPDPVEYEAGIYKITLLDTLSGPVYPILFACAAVALFIILDSILNQKNMNPYFTIHRLEMPVRNFAFALAGYYFMVFLLLVMVQILLFLVIGVVFRLLVGGGNMGLQDMMLIFVIGTFPARLLPIGHPWMMIAEVLQILSFSVAGMCYSVITSMEKTMRTQTHGTANSFIYTCLPACCCTIYFVISYLYYGIIIIATLLTMCQMAYNIYKICRIQDRCEGEER